ncbi:MAG: hypothetical protein PHU04_03090 [Candidatus Peribacteraceae bacterium]|nr:hypothetical protein [Candidatus Peribacteraceae bacterium]
MTKQFALGSTVGVIASIGLMAAVPVMAYRGDSAAAQGRGQFAPRFAPEHHEEMVQAIESNDYEAWKALMEENGRGGPMVDSINEENFDTFVQMHTLMIAGDREGAEALREQLGLSVPPMRRGSGDEFPGRGFGTPQQHEEILQAIESGDYNAWKALMEEKPGRDSRMLEMITEENFAIFAAMHEKMKAGDKEGVEALRTQLGIEAPGGKFDAGEGWKNGMMRGKRGEGRPFQAQQESEEE